MNYSKIWSAVSSLLFLGILVVVCWFGISLKVGGQDNGFLFEVHFKGLSSNISQ
jgi:hypothetical protein